MEQSKGSLRAILLSPWSRLLGILVLLGLVVAFFLAIRQILVPFFVGLALAYLLDPVVNWLEARRVPRGLGIVLLVVAIVASVVLVALYVIPRAQSSIVAIAHRVPTGISTLEVKLAPMWRDLDARYHDQIVRLTERAKVGLQENLPKLFEPVRRALQRAFSSFVNFFVSLVSVIFVPVFTFYLLKDIKDVKALAVGAIPPRYRERVLSRAREVDEVISAFVNGQLVVATILSAIYVIGLTIIGVPGAFLVGIFCGYANLIPYLGIATGIPLASVLAFMESQSFSSVLWVLGLFALAQLLEGTLVSPYVVGEKVGLHPVVMILALMIWGEFFGFIGLLIAIPGTAAISVFARAWYRSYVESAFYRGEGGAPQ